MRSATRNEWPDVVGSRDSIAVTEALTKPSNSAWMFSSSRLFCSATAACEASEAARLMKRSG